MTSDLASEIAELLAVCEKMTETPEARKFAIVSGAPDLLQRALERIRELESNYNRFLCEVAMGRTADGDDSRLGTLAAMARDEIKRLRGEA